ncbi:MAG: prenyltransferase [Kutzneria sp.]|nr:prenyltransferase [Kutzneria sp.]MBV9844779.1 prenyltransferase [Kutzneria sp.]
MPPDLANHIQASIADAAGALFTSQRPNGSWPNPRPTAVLGTAGALAALHLADGHRSPELISSGARWLTDAQNADGGWGGVAGMPTQIVPTAVAAATLHLLAPTAANVATRRALDLLASPAGLRQLSDPTMAHMAVTFLSLAGLHDARELRRIPLELLLLPERLWRERISFRAAPLVALAFTQASLRPPSTLGRIAHRLARPTGLRLLRRIEHQENRPGGYGGDNWLAALVCIGLSLGGGPRQAVDDTVSYLRSNVESDGSWHIMQGLDVIGGAFVARGLAQAGYARDARVRRACTWLGSCQQGEAFSLFDSPAGGWNWEGPRGWPNILDSAVTVSALTAAECGESDSHRRRGLEWLDSRQDRTGSWGTFVPDTTLSNDGPCPYVTAQCVEVLLDAGVPHTDRRVARSVRWLLANHRPDGTFAALWYRGLTAGTAEVVAALVRADAGGHRVARRAVEVLLAGQLHDGSWGPGDTGVPGDDAATGTVEETAWALRALLVAGIPPSDPRMRRALGWMLAAQRPDGLWPASPVCMHIRDHAYYVDGLIVNGLVLRALAKYRSLLRKEDSAP